MINAEYDYAITKYRYRFIDDKLKKMAISRAEIPYLVKIHKAGGHILMNDIVGEVLYHKSHATRAIMKLVKDGFIIKEKNPNDKRGYILYITETGKEVALKAKNAIESWDKLIKSVITDEEKEVMYNITKKIYILLKEYYKEEDIINETNI